jgi:hypothetical protein
VTRRPFLLSDLDQKGLFLETATGCYALGKRASCELLVFLKTCLCIWAVLQMHGKNFRENKNYLQTQALNLNSGQGMILETFF